MLDDWWWNYKVECGHKCWIFTSEVSMIWLIILISFPLLSQSSRGVQLMSNSRRYPGKLAMYRVEHVKHARRVHHVTLKWADLLHTRAPPGPTPRERSCWSSRPQGSSAACRRSTSCREPSWSCRQSCGWEPTAAPPPAPSWPAPAGTGPGKGLVRGWSMGRISL